MNSQEKSDAGGAAARPNRPALTSALQHPLATMLTGFLLTGVAGTMLTNHYSELRQREAAAIYQRDARKKAVLELSRSYAELLVHADLLAAALERSAPREVVQDLKSQFDEASIAWATKRPETLLLAREVIGDEDFENLRTIGETRLAKKRMAPAHACLVRAYAETVTGGDGAAVARQCEASRLLAESHVCSEAIGDVLYELSGVSHLPLSDPQAVSVRAKARQAIEQGCP